jgi:hypothetical protein
VCGEEKNTLYWADESSQGKIKNLLYWHDEPNEPAKEGPLSFVLYKSPFASVSTVSRGHPSPVSLATTVYVQRRVLVVFDIIHIHAQRYCVCT